MSTRFMLRRIRRGALSRTTQQRVYAALFLARAFVFSRGFLYTLGLDWFRYLYVMLYVGRIAVLFLFVLMSLEKGSQRHTTLRGAYGPQRRRRAGLAALGLCRRNLRQDTFLSTGTERLTRGIYEANLPNVLRTLLYVQWGEALLVMGVLLVLGMVGAIAISLPELGSPFRQSSPRGRKETRKKQQHTRPRSQGDTGPGEPVSPGDRGTRPLGKTRPLGNGTMKHGVQNPLYRKPHAPARSLPRQDNRGPGQIHRDQASTRVLVSVGSGWISRGRMEAVRLAIVRRIRRDVSKQKKPKNKPSLAWSIARNRGITQKGANVRMGKGKGKVDQWVARVRPGTPLVSIHKVPRSVRAPALRHRQRKLPLATRVRYLP